MNSCSPPAGSETSIGRVQRVDQRAALLRPHEPGDVHRLGAVTSQHHAVLALLRIDAPDDRLLVVWALTGVRDGAAVLVLVVRALDAVGAVRGLSALGVKDEQIHIHRFIPLGIDLQRHARETMFEAVRALRFVERDVRAVARRATGVVARSELEVDLFVRQRDLAFKAPDKRDAAVEADRADGLLIAQRHVPQGVEVGVHIKARVEVRTAQEETRRAVKEQLRPEPYRLRLQAQIARGVADKEVLLAGHLEVHLVDAL